MSAWLDSRQVTALHQHLDEIPTLYADLPHVLTGIRGEGGGVRRPPSSRPPLAVHIVDMLDKRDKGSEQWADTDPRDRSVLDRYGIVPRVALWVRMIDEEMDEAGEHVLTLDAGDWHDLTALCQAIKSVTSWIIGQQWVTELADDMSALRSELRSALGIRAEYKPQCRNVWCGTTLEPMDKGSWYSCPGCMREYVVAADLVALGAAQYLKAEDVAQLLDVPYSTIRRWKADRIIRPVDRTREGLDLYDLDAVRVVRDTPAEARVKVS